MIEPSNCLDCASNHAGIGSLYLTALRVDCTEEGRTVFDDDYQYPERITPPDWCPRRQSDG